MFDEIGDDFEALDAAVDVRRGEDRGFELEQGAVAVEDEVAVGVADRVSVDVFAAVLGVRELTDDFIEFAAGVLSAEEEEKEAFAATFFKRCEVVDDIVGENFCGKFIACTDALSGAIMRAATSSSPVLESRRAMMPPVLDFFSE